MGVVLAVPRKRLGVARTVPKAWRSQRAAIGMSVNTAYWQGKDRGRALHDPLDTQSVTTVICRTIKSEFMSIWVEPTRFAITTVASLAGPGIYCWNHSGLNGFNPVKTGVNCLFNAAELVISSFLNWKAQSSVIGRTSRGLSSSHGLIIPPLVALIAASIRVATPSLARALSM